MERQLLALFLLCLAILNSCQASQIDLGYNQPNEIPLVFEEQVLQEIIEEEIVPNNIWEYMAANSSTNDNYVINEQTLLFMNNHIKDIDKFNEYLNKSFS